MNDVIEWLESPQGTAWSHQRHEPLTFLLTAKDDVTESEDWLWYANHSWSTELAEAM